MPSRILRQILGCQGVWFDSVSFYVTHGNVAPETEQGPPTVPARPFDPVLAPDRMIVVERRRRRRDKRDTAAGTPPPLGLQERQLEQRRQPVPLPDLVGGVVRLGGMTRPVGPRLIRPTLPANLPDDGLSASPGIAPERDERFVLPAAPTRQWARQWARQRGTCFSFLTAVV
jgi:hypothetical protein